MSLAPPGTTPSYDISLSTFVQVAVTCAVLYDHVLSLSREVELIWMKPFSLITVLYVMERYLGDIVLIASLCLCLSVFGSNEVGIRLFQFRAWGAIGYAWATQATMQLRIYAMYRRSRRTLALLLSAFFCEIAAIAFIIWRTLGPNSLLKAITNIVPDEHFCVFSSVDARFVYMLIPFLCFEFFLFVLVTRVFVENIKQNRKAKDDKGFRVNTFMKVLVRDSLLYFFVNLVAGAIVIALWMGIAELYASLCVPFVMLLEVLVGTRLILDFRERYTRPDDPVVSGRSRCSSLYFFRGDDIQMDSICISVQCDIETIVVRDAGV